MAEGKYLGPDKDEVARSLTELLAIAKVAMPDFLYGVDPRVHRALQLLARLGDQSASRPPSVPRMPPMEMLDLAPSPTLADVAAMPGAESPWDITVGLDAFMDSPEAPSTRAEAVALILLDWLTSNGYLPLPPSDEQQH